MIAKDLRVSVCSVQRRRQSWDEGGPRALRFTGAGVTAEVERGAVRPAEGGAGQGTGHARLGNPTLGPERREDGDRSALPLDLHG